MVITEQEIKRITRGVIDNYLVPRFLELDHNASGEWIEELDVRSEVGAGVITGLDYTEYPAQGRPPNNNADPKALKAWAGWAGNTFIKDWVDDKGLNINSFAVAYNIAKKGTDLYQKGGEPNFLDILNTKEVQDFIITELEYGLTVSIQNTLMDSLKKLKNS